MKRILPGALCGLALLAAPFLWVAAEFWRTHVPAIGFPWNLLGYTAAQGLAVAQLASLTEQLPELDEIGEALGGDQRYVASPRVDSYHGIWFELHEDLIQLAGRSRADEVAEGRA